MSTLNTMGKQRKMKCETLTDNNIQQKQIIFILLSPTTPLTQLSTSTPIES